MHMRPGSVDKRMLLPVGGSLLAALGVYLLARSAGESFGWAAALSGAVLLAIAGCWAAFSWRSQALLLRAARRQAEDRLGEALNRQTEDALRLAEDQRRLNLVLSFNRSLVEARDEKSLMDAALSAISDLVGALGCSFVPVDEWEQPLPAFTFGQLPEPVLRAWAGHLAGTALRERCESCDVLQSTPGGCPLHPQSVGSSLTVYCLPLRGGRDQRERTLGILNLYLPTGRMLDADTGRFLEGLLPELALAIETTRLRGQELSTLRQIQLLHAPLGGLSDSLGGLLENLQTALEADTVWLRLRPSADERLSGLSLLRGPVPALSPLEINRLFERVLLGETERAVQKTAQNAANAAPGATSDAAPADTAHPALHAGYWLALPMRLPEGQVPGMLLVGRASGLPFHPRQEAILQTVAAQAALLVENERMLRSLEYRAIIHERTRLAREIHDGLAQTLAFLKLQSAQMLSYLAQGDLTRLSQVLKDNYQTLAEAYLDTRQSIDNLRLTPRNGLEASLEQIAADFKSDLNLTVERSIMPLSEPWVALVTPEVQAQLVRIVQEALNNVRKHAHAQRVWIHLREWQGELLLEVGDDGLGFDADDVPEISQHGLRGMRERSELIGADFQIISQVHHGTLVRLALPAYLKETSQ